MVVVGGAEQGLSVGGCLQSLFNLSETYPGLGGWGVGGGVGGETKRKKIFVWKSFFYVPVSLSGPRWFSAVRPYIHQSNYIVKRVSFIMFMGEIYLNLLGHILLNIVTAWYVLIYCLTINILSLSRDIAIEWIPRAFADQRSTLVQIRTWCCQATGHYLNRCWPSSSLGGSSEYSETCL